MSGHICTQLKAYLSFHFLVFLWMAGLLISEMRQTQGMTVTSSGQQTIHKALGESVILSCRYTPSPSDTGELDIEWSVISPDTTQKDQMVMSYASGNTYHHNENFAKGIDFVVSDPSQGDASLSMSQLLLAHSATYQCKVKKSPGVDSVRMTLVVMVKPSVPKCWVEGEELVGDALSLHCKSAEGSTPLKYTWRRDGMDPMPAATAQNSASGELKISNHSQSLAGIYLCEVNNAVGAAHCRINLKANKPPSRAAVIAGNIVGSILIIFLVLVFIALLFWKLNNRCHHEKEYSNEIREDVLPPESRPVSRYTSRSADRRLHLDGSELSSFDDVTSQGTTPVKYVPVADEEIGNVV